MGLGALSERLAIMATVDPQDVHGAAVESDWVDMSKFERAIAILLVGATTDKTDFKVQQATDASGTSKKDITGKAITQLGTGDDNKQAIIEIRQNDLDLALGFTHINCVVTGDSTGAGDLAAALILGGDASYEPADDGDLASVAEIVR
jgi:hypothetical protein